MALWCPHGERRELHARAIRCVYLRYPSAVTCRRLHARIMFGHAATTVRNYVQLTTSFVADHCENHRFTGLFVMQHSAILHPRLLPPRSVLLLLFVGASLQGCHSLPRREAVPVALTQKAISVDCPNARYWPELNIEPLVLAAIESTARERASLVMAGRSGALPTANYLAISGGGDAGAFGAGILVGWTKRGGRPEFKVVTGVSAILSAVSMSIGAKDVFHTEHNGIQREESSALFR